MRFSKKTIVGRAEKVDLVDFGVRNIPAKIDTGAYRTAIWASKVNLKADKTLEFTLFGPSSPHYTGKVLSTKKFGVTRVKNSMGMTRRRFVITTRIKVGGKVIKASVSLANRSHNKYPILVGRTTLRNRFIVDVTKGQPLPGSEARSHKIYTKKFHEQLRRGKIV